MLHPEDVKCYQGLGFGKSYVNPPFGPPSFNIKAKHFNRLRFVKRKSPVGFIHLCESRSRKWNIQIM